jgi:hypothetical protein
MGGAQLDRHGLGDAVYQFLGPRRAEAHRPREHRGLSEPGDAVQRFGSGTERGDAETENSRRVLVEQRDSPDLTD